ncbi:MAG: efflux RND transporter periplasmic adaptor subunit [Geminicoccaceae bacterium]|nr:efflux RND transporter periplasmic adaptor subunit [Geminicoccaceae bacterium]
MRALAFLLAGVLLAAVPAAAEVFVAQRRTIEDRKAVFATVESVREVEARARISGTLSKLLVREGDRVEAGALLAEVEDRKLALELTALDARLDALAAQRRQAAQDLERARTLRAQGAVPQARLDEAQAAFDVIEAQIAATRAERAVVEERRREGRVLAPQAGRVLAVRGTEGSVVMAGETVARLATRTYVLRLRLPERHARFMRAGDPVEVGARGLAERPEAVLGTGRLVLVYPELDNGQVVADAEVEGLGDFFVGERVRVTIAADRREAVLVPLRFVRRAPGVDLVRLESGLEVPVQRGPVRLVDGEPMVEILSGVVPGDRLVPPGGAGR